MINVHDDDADRETHSYGAGAYVTKETAVQGHAMTMDPEKFNLSVRKFLKMIGVNSQREIERAVEKALQQGRVSGSESLAAKVTLDIPALGLKVPFDGEIRLK